MCLFQIVHFNVTESFHLPHGFPETINESRPVTKMLYFQVYCTIYGPAHGVFAASVLVGAQIE